MGGAWLTLGLQGLTGWVQENSLALKRNAMPMIVTCDIFHRHA